jgi:hypothetical protein
MFCLRNNYRLYNNVNAKRIYLLMDVGATLARINYVYIYIYFPPLPPQPLHLHCDIVRLFLATPQGKCKNRQRVMPLLCLSNCVLSVFLFYFEMK